MAVLGMIAAAAGEPEADERASPKRLKLAPGPIAVAVEAGMGDG